MNFPFLSHFKKKKAEVSNAAVAVAPSPPPPLDKPASERFGKTVMPNNSRIVGVAPASDFSMVPPIGNPPPAEPAEPRKISLGAGGGVVALQPKAAAGAAPSVAERSIALRLADIVPHLPEGLLGSMPIDPEHRVLFKASELERGMARARPTSRLRAVYQQAPEFFATTVAEDDEREVALPFAKVLEQFTTFQLRPDQVVEQDVPEVDTPFLKMTRQDSERLGKTAAPIAPPKFAAPEMKAAEETQPVASVPPAPVQAKLETAAAPAAPVLAPPTIRPLRMSLPNEAVAAAAVTPAPVAPSVPKPIAPKISPNGTGVPANERVPASGGPPVPTLLPSPFAPPPPVRIPFKVSAPSNDLRAPVLPTLPTLEPAPASMPKAKTTLMPDEPRIRLPLRNILRGISPFQLSAPTNAVPETAEIEIAFAILEPQLSLGRVSISPAQFEAALPEEYRAVLKLEDPELPVALPLEDVLQNLPNESLRLRGDQEEIVVTNLFATPFSAKAEEDAARLKASPGPIAKPSAPEAPKVESAIAPLPGPIATPVKAVPNEPATRNALQELFETDDALDAKSVVAHASRLPGVSACAIVFSDGLSLAGNIPAEYGAEALCALAPTIVKRINEQMHGTNFGDLTAITLFCARTPVSFFAHDNICLAALHAAGEITAEIRSRLHAAVRELATIYRQPA